MNIVTGIVAHKLRRTMADELAKKVDACYVSVDEGDFGVNANHQRVWDSLGKTSVDWAIVLEDDAVPVDGFLEEATAALATAPASVVSFYLGKLRPPNWQMKIRDALAKAEVNDASWIVGTHLLHAVAVAVPIRLIPSMINHMERRRYLPPDQAIGNWARANQHLIAYTHPSLVDHRDVQSIATHIDPAPRKPGRVAWEIGTRGSWTTDSVAL